MCALNVCACVFVWFIFYYYKLFAYLSFYNWLRDWCGMKSEKRETQSLVVPIVVGLIFIVWKIIILVSRHWIAVCSSHLLCESHTVVASVHVFLCKFEQINSHNILLSIVSEPFEWFPRYTCHSLGRNHNFNLIRNRYCCCHCHCVWVWVCWMCVVRHSI